MNVTDFSMEGLKILLTLAIVILGVSVGLIGYFMSKRDTAITTATDNLTKAVDQLQIIVNGLQTQYQIRQPIVDERLKAHGEILASHENRIQIIETEHSVYHCKYQSGEKTSKKMKP